MGFIFGNATTYSWDLPLFEKLGLKPFEIENQEKTFIGEHKLPDYDKASVKIWVTCMPAMFWHFEVTTDEGKVFKIDTGSGSLSNYWDSIEKIATDMLVVNAL